MDELIRLAPSWLPGVLGMACLTLVSAFFSASETALFYLSHDELRGFRVGNPRERRVAALLLDPDRLLTAVLFWNLLVNLTYFALGVVVAQRLAHAGYSALGAVFSIASVAGIILFGEVLPKSLAVVLRRWLASQVSLPLSVAVRIFDPVAPFFLATTKMARRTFWPRIQPEPYLEPEDLEQAVENTELSDDVAEHERQVLHNILDLSEIVVEEAMRPRGTYVSLRCPIRKSVLDDRILAQDYVVVQTGSGEDVDQVISLANLRSVPDDALENVAEDVVQVPWCANLADTLGLLRQRFCNVAAVVNEYGETIGIVTHEDIVDTILAPQPSRVKRILRREPILEVAPNRYHIEGMTTLRTLCQRLEMEYEPTTDGQYTLAGLLLDRLGRIPEVGDEITWRDCTVRVIEVSLRGQPRLMLSRIDDAAEEGAETDG